MKKRKVILFTIALITMLFASIVNSQKSEAAQEIDMNNGAVFTFDSSGAWKRIYSGVYMFEAGRYGYDDYSGEIQYAQATANSRSIQAAYVVKDRIFDFVGTYSPSESYFNGDTKIWAYNVTQVNGLTPVFKTTVSITQGAYGTSLFVKANRSIVPNWAALPNVGNMSKVTIEPAYISMNLQ